MSNVVVLSISEYEEFKKAYKLVRNFYSTIDSFVAKRKAENPELSHVLDMKKFVIRFYEKDRLETTLNLNFNFKVKTTKRALELVNRFNGCRIVCEGSEEAQEANEANIIPETKQSKAREARAGKELENQRLREELAKAQEAQEAKELEIQRLREELAKAQEANKANIIPEANKAIKAKETLSYKDSKEKSIKDLAKHKDNVDLIKKQRKYETKALREAIERSKYVRYFENAIKEFENSNKKKTEIYFKTELESLPYFHLYLCKMEGYIYKVFRFRYNKECMKLANYNFAMVDNIVENAKIYIYHIRDRKNSGDKNALDKYIKHIKMTLKAKDILFNQVIIECANQSKLTEKSKDKYRGALRNHWLRFMGESESNIIANNITKDIKVANLTKELVKEFVKEYLNNSGIKAVINYISILNKVLDYAYELEYLSNEIKAKKEWANPYEVGEKVLITETRARLFLQYDKEKVTDKEYYKIKHNAITRLGALFVMFSNLRVGAVGALQWKDLDFDLIDSDKPMVLTIPAEKMKCGEKIYKSTRNFSFELSKELKGIIKETLQYAIKDSNGNIDKEAYIFDYRNILFNSIILPKQEAVLTLLRYKNVTCDIIRNVANEYRLAYETLYKVYNANKDKGLYIKRNPTKLFINKDTKYSFKDSYTLKEQVEKTSEAIRDHFKIFENIHPHEVRKFFAGVFTRKSNEDVRWKNVSSDSLEYYMHHRLPKNTTTTSYLPVGVNYGLINNLPLQLWAGYLKEYEPVDKCLYIYTDTIKSINSVGNYIDISKPVNNA